MTANKTTDSRPGITVDTPKALMPDLIIPYNIAREWMMYGRIGYEDHNSEWGCAVRLQRDEEKHIIHVVEWEPYKIDATAGYWESIDGERQRHADELIAAGKEDELQEWNGLFHTHPIGSGASMSGTDKQQLQDMAAGGWWAASIISPANREGVVYENKFMFHYADSRHAGGMYTASNLKPKISSEIISDELQQIKDQMKELMVKVPKAPTTTSSHSGSWGRATKKWDTRTREMVDVNTIVSPVSYPYGERDIPQYGDWVYIEHVDMDMVNADKMEDAELLEFMSLPGKIGRVVKHDTRKDGVTVSVQGFKMSWVLDPKQYGRSPWGDDVLVIARNGTLEADIIKKGIEEGIDPVQMGCVRAIMNRASIKNMPTLVTTTIGKDREITKQLTEKAGAK
jgi:hypothetical protein